MQDIIDQHYKYILVSGKGGVGKSSCSSSLALQIARQNPDKKYLLISTDPAHNLSDIFQQQFGNKEQQVKFQDNLYCIELNPQKQMQEEAESVQQSQEVQQQQLLKTLSQLFVDVSSFPGMDEILNFIQIMEFAQDDKYDTVIFDTAPTGHTLRFLSLPQTATKLFGAIDQLKQQLLPMITMIMQMQGQDSNQIGELFDKLNKQFKIVQKIKQQFEDPSQTTVISVTIPEFLSVYETERLVQHLCRLNIDCNTIIINQIINEKNIKNCELCKARSKMQQKYLKQIDILYEDFKLKKMYLGPEEIRGQEKLLEFGKKLL